MTGTYIFGNLRGRIYLMSGFRNILKPFGVSGLIFYYIFF